LVFLLWKAIAGVSDQTAFCPYAVVRTLAFAIIRSGSSIIRGAFAIIRSGSRIDDHFGGLNWKKRSRLTRNRCHKQDWLNHLKLVQRMMK
jgi:hypothetical protein